MLLKTQASIQMLYTIVIFYWLCYIFGLVLFFYCIAQLFYNNIFNFFEISNLQHNKLLFLMCLCVFTSFAGLPPMLGFWGKLVLVFFFIKNMNIFFSAILICVALFSLLFYLFLLRYLFNTNDLYKIVIFKTNITLLILFIFFILMFGFFIIADIYLVCLMLLL